MYVSTGAADIVVPAIVTAGAVRHGNMAPGNARS
jgi:hypothetical protein